MNITGREELLETRALVYSILSSVFLHHPTADQLALVLEQGLLDEFPLELDDEGFRRGLEELRRWADESHKKDRKSVLTELKVDYAALFVGPGHLLAPPWESVYLTEERLTFGEPTLEVREFYLRHGLQYERKNLEPDDHFGLELKFMAMLITRERQYLTDGDQEKADELVGEQLAFLREHLMKWADNFTDDVINHCQTSYFRGFALIARSFLHWDYALLRSSKALNS